MSALNSVHRALARSSSTARLCAKIRNQANCVISYHLGEIADPQRNGEYSLIDLLAPDCFVFVDVGANIGEWSAHFLNANRAVRGILFEPSSTCVAALGRRFYSQPVTIKEIGVSDRKGAARFVQEAGCGEGSSFAETRENGNASNAVLVNATTLDAEFSANSDRIDFLKIDAEGYDLKILRGARGLFSGKRIRFVQFEYNEQWLGVGSSLREAKRFLLEFDFQLFLVRSTGLHPLNYSLWGDYFRYSNYFACGRNDLDMISPLLGERI